MNQWIHQALSNEHASFYVLAAVFLLGVLSVFTCACNFAIIGVVAGYSGASQASGKTRIVLWKGLSFLLGTILAMALVGALFGYAGNWISASLGNYWKIAAGLIAIFFGLYTMDLVPFKLPGVNLPGQVSDRNMFTAILFGFAVGGLSAACNTCCNPFFPVVLAASFINGSALWGFLMLLCFALGFGLPLTAMVLGIGMGLGKIPERLSQTVNIVKYAGGFALVAFGFYLLVTL